MENVTHWTQNNIANFVYEISSTYVAQLETKMEKEKISRSQLASRLKKTTGRVSQVFNDPGNLGLRLIVEYARELGMKVSIVAYDDGDPNNEKGPVNPEVFVKCWEKQNCPANLFEVEKAETAAVLTNSITAEVPIAEGYYILGYDSMLSEGKMFGTYSTIGAIALDSSPSLNFSPEPINSAPYDNDQWRVA